MAGRFCESGTARFCFEKLLPRQGVLLTRIQGRDRIKWAAWAHGQGKRRAEWKAPGFSRNRHPLHGEYPSMTTRSFLVAAALLAALAGTSHAIPVITFTASPSVVEGHPNLNTRAPDGGIIELHLTLSEPAPFPCQFKFTERPGSTAKLGVDYEIPATGHTQITAASEGRYVLDAGVQTAVLRLRCIGDWIGEPDEVLSGSLTSPFNCTIPSPNWSTAIEDDDRALFAVLNGGGTSITVRIFDDRFRVIHSFSRTGVFGASPSLAMGEVYDSDGVPEIVVGSDVSDRTRFYVYRWYGSPGLGEKVEYEPFGQDDPASSGCHVAVGDCGGYSSADEVIVGTRGGRLASAQIWSLPDTVSPVRNPEMKRQVTVNPAGGLLTGGWIPGTGDVEGDGHGDLLMANGPQPQYPGRVGSYRGGYGDYFFTLTGVIFEPYPGNTDGLSVSAGDWNGDGCADLVTGAGPNSGSHVLVYDPLQKQALHGFFVTTAAQNFMGGARVAMQPRRHYSPSGGTRTLLLASSISVAHPGALHSSDGTPPVTPPAGLLDTPRCAIAAWTPWQDRPGTRTVLHFLGSRPEPQNPAETRCQFRITGLPPNKAWSLESSPNLQSWTPRSEFLYHPSGPTGTNYCEISVFGALGPKHFWRLRSQ
jgi:hypothetical protein